MPTIARRPAAQQQRHRLQERRLRVAELFATGVRQAEVARQLGVSRQSVHLVSVLADPWRRRPAQPRPDRTGAQAVQQPAPSG